MHFNWCIFMFQVAKLFSYSWSMGLFLCKGVHYLQHVSAICSVLTLTAMSIERSVCSSWFIYYFRFSLLHHLWCYLTYYCVYLFYLVHHFSYCLFKNLFFNCIHFISCYLLYFLISILFYDILLYSYYFILTHDFFLC